MNQGKTVQTLLSCGAGVLNTRGVKAVDMAISEQMRLINIEKLPYATANSDRTITFKLISVV